MLVRIKEIRKKCGLTQKELGERVGVSEAAISQYESGKRRPDYEIVLRMADYFGCSVDYLLGNDSSPPSDPELDELLESLRSRPEMRMLFNLANNATKEDVLRAVKIIEALKEG
jgi:transcriptional regulator with XRE-family HTH domain